MSGTRTTPAISKEVLHPSLLLSIIQWNLRIRDTLVHKLVSLIRRLSFIRRFLVKLSFYTVYMYTILVGCFMK